MGVAVCDDISFADDDALARRRGSRAAQHALHVGQRALAREVRPAVDVHDLPGPELRRRHLAGRDAVERHAALEHEVDVVVAAIHHHDVALQELSRVRVIEENA